MVLHARCCVFFSFRGMKDDREVSELSFVAVLISPGASFTSIQDKIQISHNVADLLLLGF